MQSGTRVVASARVDGWFSVVAQTARTGERGSSVTDRSWTPSTPGSPWAAGPRSAKMDSHVWPAGMVGGKIVSSKSMDFQSGLKFLDAVTSNSRYPSDLEPRKPPSGPAPESARFSSPRRSDKLRPLRTDSIPPRPAPRLFGVQSSGLPFAAECRVHNETPEIFVTCVTEPEAPLQRDALWFQLDEQGILVSANGPRAERGRCGHPPTRLARSMASPTGMPITPKLALDPQDPRRRRTHRRTRPSRRFWSQ